MTLVKINATCDHPGSMPNLAPAAAKCGAPFRGDTFADVEQAIVAHWIAKHGIDATVLPVLPGVSDE